MEYFLSRQITGIDTFFWKQRFMIYLYLLEHSPDRKVFERGVYPEKNVTSEWYKMFLLVLALADAAPMGESW